MKGSRRLKVSVFPFFLTLLELLLMCYCLSCRSYSFTYPPSSLPFNCPHGIASRACRPSYLFLAHSILPLFVPPRCFIPPCCLSIALSLAHLALPFSCPFGVASQACSPWFPGVGGYHAVNKIYVQYAMKSHHHY